MAVFDCCVGTWEEPCCRSIWLLSLINRFFDSKTSPLERLFKVQQQVFPHLHETCLEHQLYATVFRAHSRHAQTALFAGEAQLLTRLLQLLQGTNLVCLHKIPRHSPNHILQGRLCVAGCAEKLWQYHVFRTHGLWEADPAPSPLPPPTDHRLGATPTGNCRSETDRC